MKKARPPVTSASSISLFFALALVPMVDAIAGKIRVPRALIILGVYLVLIAGVALIGGIGAYWRRLDDDGSTPMGWAAQSQE